MQISLESKPYKDYTLVEKEKRLTIPDKYVTVDVSDIEYAGYSVYMYSGYGILTTNKGCTIDVSFNSIVKTKRNCIITAGMKSNVTTGDECQITARNECFIRIGSNCGVHTRDKCVIHMNEYVNHYNNTFFLGNHNIIILNKFDDIKKNTFTSYGEGNIIIGVEDGTRLLMDKNFERLMKICD